MPNGAMDLRVLSYLDEVSSTSLQMYNMFVAAIASRDAIAEEGPTLPDDWLLEKMRVEWCEGPVAVDAALHWLYATSPVPADPEQGDPQYHGRDAGNEGMALSDFASRRPAVEARLTEADVLALRLYTGEFFRHCI